MRRDAEASRAYSKRYSSINMIHFTKLAITSQWISVSLDYSNIEEVRGMPLLCHEVLCLSLTLSLSLYLYLEIRYVAGMHSENIFLSRSSRRIRFAEAGFNP
jgi:hypothetical protein